ncbi:MAG TPA: VanZ family protein [Myxococcaceae bacterium]|nr:VanZ family protein [Myxococcaceae bacterium]
MSRLVRRWGPAVAWAALIFALSAQPSPPGPSMSPLDKVAHFVEFAVLAALVARALTGSGVRPTRALAAAIALSTLYGASDELHQRYVPGRDVSVFDLAADAVGACAGACAWYALWSRSARGDRR